MNKKLTKLTFSMILAVFIMYMIERFLQPGYFIKSIIKIIVFTGTIYIVNRFFLDIHLESFFEALGIRKIKTMKICIILAFLTYFTIIFGYYMIRNYIDAAQITNNLLAKENIDQSNFVYVTLYISFVNSFLEEAFFRGFAFLKVKQLGYRKYGYFMSAFMFAIYHIGIMTSWFDPIIFILLIFLLFIAGIILNYLCERSESFLASWLIHIAANLGINTIGFVLLGIL